jgi:hypothetical protein
LAKEQRHDPQNQAVRRTAAGFAGGEGGRNHLNLFSDVQIVALRVRAERDSRGDSWFGSIKGDKFGRAILTVVGGRLGALVTHMARHYMVLPAASGLHEVLEVREDSFATAPSAGGWRPRSQIGMTSADVDGIIRAMDARAVGTNPDTRDIRAMVGDYLSDFKLQAELAHATQPQSELRQ